MTAAVLVFGAGPAGLAAAHALHDRGIKPMVVESGLGVDERDRANPRDLVAGVGGAGLYSDGKFSWYPSATKLWSLEDQASLRDSYAWFGEVLNGLVPVPSFPVIPKDAVGAASVLEVQADAGLTEKNYVSGSVDFHVRTALIEGLAVPLADVLHLGETVRSISWLEGGFEALVSDRLGQFRVIRPSAMIMAGGRFGGQNMPDLRTIVDHRFRRLELGVRLELPARHFFLRDHPCMDPKFIWSDQSRGLEWRTFCTCRNGEVVQTDFDGLVTYSGRSDGSPTQFSNVGFNLRLKSAPPPGSALANETADLLNGRVPAFKSGLREYLNGDVAGYGPALDELIREGLGALDLKGHEAEAVAVGPTLEGVGEYPLLDGNLKVQGKNLWFAGDQSGIFRGLTAAFVSGYFAGIRASQHLAAQTPVRSLLSR